MTAYERSVPGGVRPAFAGHIQTDQIPAGESVDTATLRTVRMMADYIRQATQDQLVQRAAADAVRRFVPLPGSRLAGLSKSAGLSNLQKCWAVFWWIKHCVTFRSDEDALLYLGLVGEQDMITSPSVLLRMKKPQEDCDGFTALACAMLACLDVPVYPVAVAVELNDPERWSHVFAIAKTSNGYEPVDASHGAYPGWMVPEQRIHRWQAFDLNGNPVDIPMPRSRSKFRGLHGYTRTAANTPRAPRPVFLHHRRRRGMGIDLSFPYATESGDSGSSSASIGFPYVSDGGGYTAGANGTAISFPWYDGTTPTNGSDNPWPTGTLVPQNQIIPPGNAVGAPASSSKSWLNSLTSSISRAFAPAGTYGGAYSVGSPAYSTSPLSGSSTSMLLLLAVGVGVLMLAGGRK